MPSPKASQKAERTKEASERLREMGYRLTPQRLMILEAVQSNDDHTSAEEVHARVVERYPDVNISTVYRTLELLKHLGLVVETDLGEGRVKYHYAEKGHHHHLVCQKCGAVLELEESVLRPLQNTLLRKYGFRADLGHFAIFGHCLRCASAKTGLSKEKR